MSIESLSKVYIGLGSNLGDRADNLRRASAWLETHSDIVLEATSSFMESAPWGVADQPAFLNAASRIRTALSPLELLRTLKAGEKILGRAPGGPRWGPRVIDLDILLFDNRIIETEELTVPHPRLTLRDFAMIPLLDLNPELLHPADGLPIRSFLEALRQGSLAQEKFSSRS